MPTWDGEKPDEYHPRGGMFAGGTAFNQTNVSGAATMGYLDRDMRPDMGISGAAWLGIAGIIVIVATLVWSWLAGL